MNSKSNISSQRCCILCGAKLPGIDLNNKDAKFKCTSCGIMFHRQQCGRRTESIKVYFGESIL